MRFIFWGLGLLILLQIVSCSSSLLEANKAMATRWLDDLNRHDTNLLATLYTDSAQLESPNWEGVKTGAAGVKEVYGRYFRGTPDMKHELTHLVVMPETIVIEYVSRGTFSNPEPGTPEYMKGKPYELKNITRMDIRDGKITKQVTYFDQVAFLRQVGFFDQK